MGRGRIEGLELLVWEARLVQEDRAAAGAVRVRGRGPAPGKHSKSMDLLLGRVGSVRRCPPCLDACSRENNNVAVVELERGLYLSTETKHILRLNDR